MSRMTTIKEVTAELEFAKRAAAHFKEHPEHSTFGDEFPEPGCLLAVRWGMGNDCVLVVKLSDDHVPTIYQQDIR